MVRTPVVVLNIKQLAEKPLEVMQRPSIVSPLCSKRTLHGSFVPDKTSRMLQTVAVEISNWDPWKISLEGFVV